MDGAVVQQPSVRTASHATGADVLDAMSAVRSHLVQNARGESDSDSETADQPDYDGTRKHQCQ